MADNFTAEAVSSAGQIFATDQQVSDSAHYPIGKLAHGALNTFTLTTTTDPFPVKLFGNDSSAPVHVTTDSGAAPKFLIDNATTAAVPVTLIGGNSGIEIKLSDTNITVTNIADNDTTVTVTGYSTVVTVTGYVAPSTTVTLTNPTDTTVTVTGYTSSVSPVGSKVQAGALQSFTTVLSSAIESATTSAARLYGWYITNPDTANFVYAKIFDDDSAGVTKGTTAASLNLGIPPSGGANVFTPQGIAMSSGISMLSAGGTGTTDTSAPSTSLVVTLFYEG